MGSDGISCQTGHVGLNVTDIERSKRFYQDVFGFEPIHEHGEGRRAFAFLGDGDRLVLTLWQQSRGTFDASGPGLHHLSFQVDTIDEVRAMETRLKGLSATFLYEGVVGHLEGESSGGIFFTDPDGVRLEIYAPTGADDEPTPAGGAPACGFF